MAQSESQKLLFIEQLQIAVKFFVPAFVITVLLVIIFFYSQTQLSLVERQAADKSAVRLAAEFVKHELNNVISDLRVLAKDETLGIATQGDIPGAREQLEKKLKTFSLEKKIFDQLRILNMEGNEVIRINYNNGKPVSVPLQQLQDKSKRYYYTEALNLKENEHFISQFDLNIEQGVIETPFKPTIRIARTFYGPSGEKAGLVILNYRGHNLLDTIRELIPNTKSSFPLFLNKHGYYLIAPPKEHAWGFMFAKEAVFASKYPEAFQYFSFNNIGQIEINSNLFTFRNIFIGKHRLTIVAQTELTSSYKDIINQHLDGIIFIIILIVVSAFASWGIAGSNLARKYWLQSEKKFADFRETASDWLWETDSQLCFTDISTRLKAITGINPDDYIGKPIDKLMTIFAEQPDFEHHLKQINSRQAIKKVVYHIESFLGQRLEFEVTAKPYSVDGVFSGYRGTSQDVTNYKLLSKELQGRVVAAETAELKIKNVAHKLSQAQRLASIGNWTFDLITEQIHCSQEVLRILGLSSDRHDISYQEYLDIIHPDDSDEIKRQHQNYKKSGSPYVIEYRIVQNNSNETHWIQERCEYHRNQSGSIIQSEGTIQDISEQKQAEADLHDSEQTIRMLLESTAEGIYAVGLDEKCFMINPAALRMLGYANETDFLGNSTHQMIHYAYADGSHYPSEDCHMHQAFLTGEKIHIDNEVFWHADGHSFPVEYYSYPIFRDKKIFGAVISFQDISKRKEAAERLAQSEQDFRNIFNSAGDGMVIHDLQGNMLAANRVICNRLGYTRDELLNMTPGDIDTPEYADKIPQHMEELLEQGGIRFETIHVSKTHHKIPTEVNSRVIFHDGQPAILSVARDITERKIAEEKIRRLANTDTLTGLANRHAFNTRFNDSLSYAQRYGQKIGLLMIDLDKFKPVNDRFGHQVGDAVLVKVAEILLTHSRDSDTVARLGGDEFALLIIGPEGQFSLDELAKRIVEALSSPLEIMGNTVQLGASIGISIYPEDGEQINLLIQKADTALYSVKNSGRNGFSFYEASMAMICHKEPV